MPLNNHHPTSLGNFRWQTEVIKKTPSYLDVCKSKVPHAFSTFIIVRIEFPEKGGSQGAQQVVEQLHTLLDILWAINRKTVLYSYPGPIAQSRHVVPY